MLFCNYLINSYFVTISTQKRTVIICVRVRENIGVLPARNPACYKCFSWHLAHVSLQIARRVRQGFKKQSDVVLGVVLKGVCPQSDLVEAIVL